jgi:iron complex transport system ATP-binding protein
MLAAHEVSVRAGGATLLDGVSLAVRPGEILCVIGPNGAGKSTLLKVLCGDIGAAAGEVRMNGRPLRDWSLRERAKARAVLPQETALGFPLPVFEVVLMGRSPHLRGVESTHDRNIAREALRLVEADHLARRAYTTLSGGERQRVQLARVLAQIWEADDARSTRYLLLDEPTAALDLAHQHAVLSLATRFAREQGIGVLAILHDLNLAALYADRIAVLKQGRLWIEGPPEMALAVEVVETVFAVRASVVRHPQRPDRWLVVADR